MKKHIRKIKAARKRYREGPLTYLVSFLDLMVLAVIVWGLYNLVARTETEQSVFVDQQQSQKQMPIAIETPNHSINSVPIVNVSAYRFIKLDAEGEMSSDDSADWACILDKQTSLIWESKPNDGSWRDKEHTYSWLGDGQNDLVDSEEGLVDNGEAIVGTEDGGVCSYISCDSQAYIEQLNQLNYCGFSDWRMPEQKEFETLDHESNYFPDIDTRYFPNTMSAQYWTRTQNKFSKTLAWSYDFSNGISYVSEKRLKFHLRAVREWNSGE